MRAPKPAIVVPLGLFATILFASVAHAGTMDEIKRGESMFASRCALCHDDSPHMLNDVGPALFGVVNRKVGSVPGYRYSPVLKAAGQRGDSWTIGRLDRLLTEPTRAYYGTSMPAAIDDPKGRKAMLAYLKTLHPGE